MELHTRLLSSKDWIPNNPKLPVLIYKSALPAEGDNAGSRIEALFQQHRWEGTWQNGVFDYHHYHVHAHEVLGVASGQASLMIGGPEGMVIALKPGDGIVLPAGTGHCLVAASEDFLVVGAYPPGQKADIKTSAPTATEQAALETLPLPGSDPVTGTSDPLLTHWQPDDKEPHLL